MTYCFVSYLVSQEQFGVSNALDAFSLRTHSGGDRLTTTLPAPPPCGCFHRFECQHIIHSMQERGVQKWVALSEGQGGSIGWLTTNERKEAMVFQLRDALRVGNIFLSDEFFSVLMEEREAIKTIRDELCRFAIITEPAKTLFGRVRAQHLFDTDTYILTPPSVRNAGAQNVYGQDWRTKRRLGHLLATRHHRASLLLPKFKVLKLSR